MPSWPITAEHTGHADHVRRPPHHHCFHKQHLPWHAVVELAVPPQCPQQGAESPGPPTKPLYITCADSRHARIYTGSETAISESFGPFISTAARHPKCPADRRRSGFFTNMLQFTRAEVLKDARFGACVQKRAGTLYGRYAGYQAKPMSDMVCRTNLSSSSLRTNCPCKRRVKQQNKCLLEQGTHTELTQATTVVA